MKVKFFKPWLLIAFLLTRLSFGAHAQNYSVRPFALAGGGESIGGRYHVIGTIGQSDASAQLVGGSPLAVPALNIAFGSSIRTNAVVSWTLKGGSYTVNGGIWPMPVKPFTLEENGDLTTTNWTLVPQSQIITGTNQLFFTAPTNGNIFYRLER